MLRKIGMQEMSQRRRDKQLRVCSIFRLGALANGELEECVAHEHVFLAEF